MIIAAVIAISAPAHADVATAGDWLQHCRDGNKSDHDQCGRFLAGVIWGYRVAQDVGGAKQTICTANTPDEKMIPVVRRWIEHNPAALDVSAPQVFVRAYQDMCPCGGHMTGNPDCSGL
ncbi:MAG TPA: Rap1a/Tai family immunity protein [Rhizomicrobium sp.]|nr:Rap1a/Tai family immunity protein [Rhizomicrobium sp.]